MESEQSLNSHFDTHVAFARLCVQHVELKGHVFIDRPELHRIGILWHVSDNQITEASRSIRLVEKAINAHFDAAGVLVRIFLMTPSCFTS